MFLDLRTEISTSLRSLRFRFPQLRRLKSFRWQNPPPSPTYQRCVLLELGYQTISDVFRACELEVKSRPCTTGEPRHAPVAYVSLFETTATPERGTASECRNGGDDAPKARKNATVCHGFSDCCESWGSGTTQENPPKNLTYPIREPQNGSDEQQDRAYPAFEEPTPDLYEWLEILPDHPKSFFPRVPGNDSEGQDSEYPAREILSWNYSMPFTLLESKCGSERQHGESSTREVPNCECTARDKRTIPHQNGFLTHNPTTKYNKPCEKRQRLTQGMADIQQDHAIAQTKKEDSATTEDLLMTTPSDSSRVTNSTLVPASKVQRAAIEFREVPITRSGKACPGSNSSRNLWADSATKRSTQTEGYLDSPAESWSNGLFDKYGSPLGSARPHGSNYFPVLKGGKKAYIEFSKAPPFNPLKDISGSTPSIASEEDVAAYPESPVPRRTWHNARRMDLRPNDENDREDTEDLRQSSAVNDVTRTELGDHDGQDQSGGHFGVIGEHLQRYLHLNDFNLDAPGSENQAHESSDTGLTSSQIRSPEDATMLKAAGQCQREGSAKDWLTQPQALGEGRISKRKGSVFDVDEALLRPRRKYRLYERNPELPSTNANQKPTETTTPMTPPASVARKMSSACGTLTPPLQRQAANTTTKPDTQAHDTQHSTPSHRLNGDKTFPGENLVRSNVMMVPSTSLVAQHAPSSRARPHMRNSEGHVQCRAADFRRPTWDNGEGPSTPTRRRAHIHPPSPQVDDVPLAHPGPQRIGAWNRQERD